MRWERLFDELEGHVEHERLEERDALVEDLREGEWAQVSWSQLLGESGGLELLVVDVGPVRGNVQFANANVVHLVAPTAEHVIAAAAVASVTGAGRPTQPDTEVMSSLSWGHVFRNLTDGAVGRLVAAGAQSVEGTVDVVGADFVRMRSATGVLRVIPFSAIRMLTLVI